MQFEQLQIEVRAGLFFAVTALVLSVATGLIAGIPLGTVIIRGIIFTAVFFAVGFVTVQILKKLVPEVYEAISSPELFSAKEDEGERELSVGMDEYGAAVESPAEEQPAGGEFTEFTEKDFDRYNTPADSGPGSTLDPSEGKMGKHVMVQEQQFNAYEPKIMAQAIKTMMSKDKD